MNMKLLMLKIRTDFKLTYVLLGINVIIFFLVMATASAFRADMGAVLYLFGAESFPDIVSGQLWRLVLPAFLHANLIHLLVNMWALTAIGVHIENFYGARKMFLVYILTGITASLASVAVTAFTYFTSGSQQELFAISVGASGALFGLIGLLLGNNYRKDAYAPQIPVNTNQLWMIVVINLFLGFGINSLGVGINNAAHIGGLAGGFLLGLFINPINTYYSSKSKARTENFLFWLSLFLVIISVLIHIIYNFT